MKGTNFKIEPIKLETVRPFIIDSVVLEESNIPPPIIADEKEKVVKFLEQKVHNTYLPPHTYSKYYAIPYLTYICTYVMY